MKLRARGDTLRLRLTRSEVDAIGAGQAVTEAMHLPDGSQLCYSLRATAEHDVHMSHGGNRVELVVEIDAAKARRWALSEQVGYSGDDPFQAGRLAVLIEKDFTCITPRTGEEESDTFPNPQAV